MSKLAAAAAVTGIGGAGGTSLLVAHSMGYLGGSGESEQKKEVVEERDPLYIAETKAGDLKKHNGGCIDHTFSGWTISSDLEDVSESVEFNLTKDDALTSGCLVFNWKKTGQDNNWIGSNFRLVWTFLQEDKGFAMYLSGTVKENKKITFEGIVYVIEKQNQAWVANQKVDPVKNTISFGESHFPQFRGENQFSDKPKEKSYWDFLDEKGENVQALADGEEATRQGRWKWIGETKKEDNKKLSEWSPNLSDWCKHFFEDAADGLAITSLVDDVHGKWEKYAN